MSRGLSRSAVVFLIGRWLSSAGDWLGASALGWFVVSEMGRGSGAFALCRLISGTGVVVCASLTGPLLERVSAGSLLVATCLFAMSVSLMMAILSCYATVTSSGVTSSGLLTLELTCAASLLSGGALAFLDASLQRYQLALVRPEQQTQLERVWTFLYYGGRLLFGLAAGVLLSGYGSPALFCGDAISFLLLASFAVAASHLKEERGQVRRRSSLHAMSRGVRSFVPHVAHSVRNYFRALQTVRARPDVRFLLWIIWIIEGVGFTAWTFLPEIVSDELKAGGFAYGLVVCVSGVGGIAGVILNTTLGKRSIGTRRKLFVGGCITAPLGLVLATLTPTLSGLCAGYAVALMGWGLFLPAIRVYFRMDAAGPLIGAMFSLIMYGVSRISQVSLAVILGTVLRIPASTSLMLSGSMSLLLVVAMFIANRQTLDLALTAMFGNTVLDTESLQCAPPVAELELESQVG